MVLNPEPHLRPLSIRRGPCPIEENRSVSDSVRMDTSLSSRGVGMSTSSTPVNSPDREAHIPSPETELVRPKAKEWRPEDARPKKKQRALGATPHSTPATTTPALPVIRDIFPEGPSSDDSDGDIYRGHSPSNPPPASPSSVNPSVPVAAPPRPVPAFAKAGMTSIHRQGIP